MINPGPNLPAMLLTVLALNAPAQIDRVTGRPFATRSEVLGQHGMVCTSHPLATQIGVDVLKAGGSAVDAAIAANAALGLMEPVSCGVGGDLFAIVWSAKDKKLYGLNASGRSPLGLSNDHQAVARPDLAPKPNVLHPAEAEEPLVGDPIQVTVEATNLGGRLADQDARHQRIVGHVAADPELVPANVLVTDDLMVVVVDVDDRGQLLHLVTLRVDGADRLLVEHHSSGIERGGVDQGDGRHAEMSSSRVSGWGCAGTAGHEECEGPR